MKQRTLSAEKKTRGKKGTKFRELSALEKEKIYREHIGLVVSVAEKYIGRSPDFTFEDLISEGVLGLFRAAEKFDKQKGYKFSTYAVWWIRQFINRSLNNYGRTIRIPVDMIEALNKYTRVGKNLSQELEREPLMEEIAAAMGITIDKARQIRKCLENHSKIISLETPPKEDENSTFSEFIEDKKTPLSVISASENILKEGLEKTLKSLTFREEKIIKMRFGLEDGIDHSLREIGKEMKVSGERIRQLIKRTLARLRNNEDLKLKKE